jgi:aspartyl/asparaginyl beta-hydroxylase
MGTIIKYLKLPFRFDPQLMQKEVSNLSYEWKAHYNQKDYEGSWTALPLRSVNGDMNNVIAAGRGSVFADNALMEQCPYLKAIADTLKCEKMSVRLLNLQPGAVIKEHTDNELSYEAAEARIHVPVMTNDGVEFYLDNERVVMNEGECWYMNFNLKHRVVNMGTTDRIHLVMDCVVNDWMRELFEGDGIEIKRLAAAPEKHNAFERKQIIDHLLELNTPTSVQMANDMLKDLPTAE